MIYNLSLVLKYSPYALNLPCELAVTCRCQLGFYNTGSNVQECLIICSASKQRWGPCEELSAKDSGSLRHAEIPTTTDTFRISDNKKSLTSYLWSHSESKLIYVSFIVVNYHIFCFASLRHCVVHLYARVSQEITFIMQVCCGVFIVSSNKYRW
jgi:hypothetical protein